MKICCLTCCRWHRINWNFVLVVYMGCVCRSEMDRIRWHNKHNKCASRLNISSNSKPLGFFHQSSTQRNSSKQCQLHTWQTSLSTLHLQLCFVQFIVSVICMHVIPIWWMWSLRWIRFVGLSVCNGVNKRNISFLVAFRFVNCCGDGKSFSFLCPSSVWFSLLFYSSFYRKSEEQQNVVFCVCSTAAPAAVLNKYPRAAYTMCLHGIERRWRQRTNKMFILCWDGVGCDPFSSSPFHF